LKAYCVRCKKLREMKSPQKVTMKNGRRATKVAQYAGQSYSELGDEMAKKKKPCPGSKIRSKGKGRGLGRGKGKGPRGVPYKSKSRR